MNKYMCLSLIFFVLTSCATYKGKYCYERGGALTECVDFKKGNHFEYTRRNDVGSNKGYGDYKLTDDEVILQFTNPPTKDEARIVIQKIEYNYNTDTIGIKKDLVYTGMQNFIKIVCTNNNKQPIKRGGVYFKSIGSLSEGVGKFSSRRDTLTFDIKNINFPLRVTFQCPGYMNHELVLEEKAQYLITAELLPNKGYNILSGKKTYSKEDFLSRKEAAAINMQELKRKVFVKTKNK